MRPATTFCIPAVLALCFCCPSFAQNVKGDWLLKECRINGKEYSAKQLGEMKLTMGYSDFKAVSAGRESSGSLETKRVRSAPSQMTFEINSGEDSGRVLKAIYKRKGTDLIVAFSPNGQFPAGFEDSSANQYAVMTYSYVRKNRRTMTDAERRANRAPTEIRGISGG